MACQDTDPRAGAHRHQDGQVVVCPPWSDDEADAHVQQQWDDRAPEEWEGHSVRAAWREAEHAWTAGDSYARRHHESGMLLIACVGILQTAVRAPTAGTPRDQPDEVVGGDSVS